MTVEKFLALLKNVKRSGNGWTALCPAHEDARCSLSIGRGSGKILVHCHAGCSADDICAALGLGLGDLFEDKRQDGGQVVATYNYRGESGKLIFQVCRTADKRFFQRRPDGNGGWINGLGNVKPVLYRLPELLQAVQRGEVAYVPEGEKDCDNLTRLGLAATTNPMGAGKWREHYSEWLKGANVVVLPDNDEPGIKHAKQVARSLHGKAASVRVLELPGLPSKGDVSDWLAAGGTKDGLLRLAAAAPEWRPTESDQVKSKNATVDEHGHDYRPTDYGNAERLVAAHGQDIKYCWPWRKWYIWTGARWLEDTRGEVLRRAKQIIRNMYGEATQIDDDRERREFLKFVLRSEQKDRLKAAVELAASETGIPVLPNEFDADPWLLNCANGTLDLRTGDLRPHRRQDMLTKQAPVAFDPDAKCPRWQQFLNEIMDGNDNLVRFLQRAAGLSLTGDTSEHLLLVLHGSGRNGKSTFLNTLLSVIGDYGMTTAPDLLLAKYSDRHPTELADLFGKRFVTAIESGEGRRFNEPLLKQLTGGDPVKARRMREDFWQFNPTHKLWLATNHKPQVRGTDLAIWSRIKLIPFAVQFPDGDPRQDKQLPAKLREELPGILRWAVEGCLAWQREGLGVPDEVRTATESYRQDQDVLAAFLAECCMVNPLAKVPAKDLYQCYLQWCDENGERATTQRDFGMRLTERGFERYRGGKKGSIVWRGIGILNELNDTEPDFRINRAVVSHVALNRKIGSVGSVTSVGTSEAAATAESEPGLSPCVRCGAPVDAVDDGRGGVVLLEADLTNVHRCRTGGGMPGKNFPTCRN
ncbi:MAG: phage/plasmid primase, P4 family [Bacillota bacterium]